ncbi:MAG: regulatory protein RecX [Candidatus Competibacteraceae bacterium]|nr:MAG: regulatory protein RecX [Candidatus Competibacteraceae bacterium]
MNWTRISERAATDDPAAVRAKALELLARREHSRLELRQKLIQRGFPADCIEPALDQLVEERWLDEARFAELYARGRADKGYGPLRIGRELRERGVPRELVDTVLAELEGDWLPKLRELHRKRFKALLPADAAGRMRQTRVLRQHGFTLDQIKLLFGGFREQGTENAPEP